MALMRSSEIPKDAVVLEEYDAAEYMWNHVNEWRKKTDVWALQYSSAILGGINAISGALVNSHFRNKLRLAQFGYFSSVIPMTIMPGVMTAMYHRYAVSTNMLLLKNEGCPMCYELRSAAIQIGMGIVYPMILGPTTAMMLANRYGTYRVPFLSEGPKVLIKFISKMARPFNLTLMNIAIFQLVASSCLTYVEMRNNNVIRRTLVEIEEKICAEREMH